MNSAFDTVRAEALFASALQASQRPSDDQVREAVTAAMRTLGSHGCQAAVAVEFGDRPETAAARMRWALATVRTAYADETPADEPRELVHAV